MTNDKCPCDRCITLAICRHKDYHDMMKDCKLISTYLYYERSFGLTKRVLDFNHKICLVRDTLKATDWYVVTNYDQYLVRKFSEPKYQPSPYE